MATYSNRVLTLEHTCVHTHRAGDGKVKGQSTRMLNLPCNVSELLDTALVPTPMAP